LEYQTTDAPRLTGGGRVLFDSDSNVNDIYSRQFDIQPGRSSLVSAFGLAEGEKLYVVQILVASYNIVTRSPSCEAPGPLGIPPEIQYMKRVTLGGTPWSLSDHNSSLIIQVPGTYVLEYAEGAGLSNPDDQDNGGSNIGGGSGGVLVLPSDRLFVYETSWESTVVRGLPEWTQRGW
jgi:hypothetical protein